MLVIKENFELGVALRGIKNKFSTAALQFDAAVPAHARADAANKEGTRGVWVDQKLWERRNNLLGSIGIDLVIGASFPMLIVKKDFESDLFGGLQLEMIGVRLKLLQRFALGPVQAGALAADGEGVRGEDLASDANFGEKGFEARQTVEGFFEEGFDVGAMDALEKMA